MKLNVNKIKESKSEKTKSRIDMIEESIKAHRKNIKLLVSNADFPKPIKKGEIYAPKNNTPRIIKFSCIPKCEKRYNTTIKNLTDQITFLERELGILLEYGA